MNGYKIVLLKAILCFIGCRKVNGYAPEYVIPKIKTLEYLRPVRWANRKHILTDTKCFPDKTIHLVKIHNITSMNPLKPILRQKRLQHQKWMSDQQPGFIPPIDITITSRSFHVQYLRVKTSFPTFPLTHKKTVSYETFRLIICFFHNDYF